MMARWVMLIGLMMAFHAPLYAAPVEVTPGSPAAYKYFPRLVPLSP